MRQSRHVPQRSCVGCRQVRPKRELVRVVRDPRGSVCLDETGKLPGRGAYLCRSEQCAERAIKQKKLGRALGVAVGAELLEEIRRVCGSKPPVDENL